ncbi:MAG: acyl-CoA dehydrogenase family protein [Pseudomonadota bacterium]
MKQGPSRKILKRKEITLDAMEIHGAYGLSDEYDIGNLYKVAISAQVVMGSLDIQRVIVAKSILSQGRVQKTPGSG